jgi:hypothetical protein
VFCREHILYLAGGGISPATMPGGPEPAHSLAKRYEIFSRGDVARCSYQPSVDQIVQRHAGRQRPSFLKKGSKKRVLFKPDDWPDPRLEMQKFFGSFFQKRTLFS